MGFDKLIEDLCTIAQDAGKEILRIYNENSEVAIEKKADDSPLTIADKASNKIICDGLRRISPEIPIISEENKQLPYSERKSFTYAWMVDPLDGTKEFIKRNGEFTVNIALLRHNKLAAGVVYVPVTGECYYAIKDMGAFMLSDNGEKKKLVCNDFNQDDKGIRVVASRSHLNPETEAFMNKLNEPVTVAKGSSLKFLVLASGNAELYPRLAPTMEWDTAAAHIILEEAGGSVVQFENGQDLEYNKENLLNPHFLASAKKQS